ncbi:efflux RND transporter periplasmic adaptor subunit [Clostridium chromiireducens]|uniref:Multidrug resistance protein MdtN n=1 Tax=Clostridium chromiireducens TaxID=225345 RepID=A0A1V4IHD5_9CLOT|nr:efflux RND transporter periplasmic adaptor subunit [Clostridium chromiireducens]OPJ59411.1 multidrug resistance protein MdtN [Clostridium chromiireducens]
MKSIKLRKYTILASIILTSSMVLAGCGKSASNTNDIKNVKTVAVSTASIENYTEYGSTLKANSEVIVAPKISGRIATMNVEVGQQVKKGDVLFTLDSAELQAQYKQAQGALSSAQANLTLISDSEFKQQLIQAKTNQSLAQNTYNDAKSAFDKVKILYEAEASTKQDLDNAQSKLNSAETQLNSANDNLNLLNNKIGSQTAAVAESQVEQAQGAVDLVQAQLDNAVVKSPIDGVVSERDADAGEIVSSSKSVITIADNSSFIGEINIRDKDLSGIAVGEKVEVKVNSFEGKNFEGVIDNISPTADSKTQLYNVKMKLAKDDSSLKSGMVVKILLTKDKKDNIAALPSNAIVVNNGVQYVYEVVEDKVKKISVSVGISDGKYTEITSGVELGDKVIIEGQSFLNDGDQVNISNS